MAVCAVWSCCSSLAASLGAAGDVRQQRRIDPFGLPRRGPALLGRRLEQDLAVAVGGIPAMPAHLAVELARPPAGIAEREDPAARPLTLGDRLEDVDRSR